ncbi:MAG: leucyl/phenylalanyl-tRNA--protein transferase [Bacteroidetes bacterium]|nr:MAG: leucyl/phenylalanyl-tRNA--protein transferase [Bacteroidota bacterium]
MAAPVLLSAHNCWFPPPHQADADGLLAMGGTLSTERLLAAYRLGIFPWYADELPLWWHPNPRFVLFPNKLRVSKSMRRIMQQQLFEITENQDFSAVIAACKNTPRKGQEGTWINQDMINAYTTLHASGMAHSYEAWENGQLVGGLYGVKLGKVFFGESMFSHKSNASKAAFIGAVQMMLQQGIQLIDCQVYTEHLESLGAEMVDRETFMLWLERYL